MSSTEEIDKYILKKYDVHQRLGKGVRQLGFQMLLTRSPAASQQICRLSLSCNEERC